MIDFGAGLMLGLALAAVLAFSMNNCSGMTPAEIDACGAACSANGGISMLYNNGECECVNGATFEDAEAGR